MATLPQVPCEVAQEAQRAWHSFIKNGFLFHTDDALATWVGNENAMREFGACVLGVCREVRKFSGARLLNLLAPFAAIAAEERERVANTLGRAFEEEFGPNAVAKRVAGKLESLLALVYESSGVAADAEGQRVLESIREAARGLSDELRPLEGFWLPRGPSEDVQVHRT